MKGSIMESAAEGVIEAIHIGFRWSTYPGDPWLQGSTEGCEPFDEVGPFKGRSDWTAIEPALLDARYCALSFFSEAGFRFFIPAYLVADVRRQLLTADPTFHLTHGFSDHSRTDQRQGRTRVHRWGKSRLVNPIRYGAISWYDHARRQLAVFPREEAGAIVTYLRWKQDTAEEYDRESVSTVEAALQLFWLKRAESAPTAQDLAEQLHEQRELSDPTEEPGETCA
jgi:hypothetical protein